MDFLKKNNLSFPKFIRMKGKKQPSSNIIEIVTYTYCISASSHDFIICLLPSPPSISFFFTAESSIGLRNKAITKASAASFLLKKMILCPLTGDGSFSLDERL